VKNQDIPRRNAKVFFFQRADAQTTTTITLTMDMTPVRGSKSLSSEKELPKLQMLRTADTRLNILGISQNLPEPMHKSVRSF